MKKYSLTTKGSSHQTSRNIRLKKILGIGVLLFLLLYLTPRLIGGASTFVFNPIVRFETWFYESGGTLPNYFKDRSKLTDEIEALKRQYIDEIGTTNTIVRLEDENTALRKLLSNDGSARIAASVIGRPTVTPYDVLILDKGRENGVVQFAPVYIGVDQAIGYVAEVYKNTSVVTLATTPGFESTVYILGPNIYTTARGIGGGVLQVSVPQGIPLKVKDIVLVPSFDAGIYGSIDVVNSVATEPEQRGYVTLDTPMQSMRFVSIGTTPLNDLSFEDVVAVVERTKRDLTKVPVPTGVLVDIESATGSASTTEERDSNFEE